MKNQHKDEHYWRLEEIYNGNFIIKNYKNPNLVLDVAGANISNNTNIQVHKRNGTNAQKFKLVQVDVDLDLAISYHQQNQSERKSENTLIK
ncbi:RICIN domain-containing protein [Bacillus cereus]|uniref:RICIN domain-containing protein n=1 Tax=Bacillus cereus TaxID=1396 RepID=UPI0011459C47